MPISQKKLRLKSMSDRDIVSKFVKEYCSDEPGSVVSKLELRTAFKQYTDVMFSQYTGNSNAVCNMLRDMDYDGTHKKRLEKDKNSVAVFRGVYFNKIKFDADVKTFVLEQINSIPQKPLKGYARIYDELMTNNLQFVRVPNV